MTKYFPSFLVLSFGLVTSVASANPITPGQLGITPDVFANPHTTPTFLFDSGVQSFSSDSGFLTGNYEEVVFIDPFGVFCSTCLDFAIAAENDASSRDAIVGIGLLLPGTGSALEDVGYVDDTGGNVNPTTASRLPTGIGVQFQFPFNSVPMLPGDTTNVLLIATNVTVAPPTSFLTFPAVNPAAPGEVINSPAFAVSLQAVPEPATVTLTALGLAGVVRRYRRRHATRA